MKKFLFDLFPVILFFGIFKWAGANPDAANAFLNQYLSGFIAGGAFDVSHAPILLATAVAILATFLQVGYLLARRKKIEPMLWVSLAIITVFGGATIYFNNETFIKWKPTVLYWLFALTLTVSVLFLKRNLIRALMQEQVELPETVWSRLNASWIAFFTVMGVLNLYVAYSYSEEAWVNFKLYGGMGLMFLFVLAQGFMLSRHIEEKNS